MATLRDIRRRIASVKNTQTITKAMQMVSAAKLRRAQERAIKARPYAEKTRELVGELCQGMTAENHPFFGHAQGSKNLGIIVITSDKGLCGSFNNNIIFRALRDMTALLRKNEYNSISLITVGKKARDYFTKRGTSITRKYAEERERTPHEVAADVTAEVQAQFLSGEWTEVHIYYSAFRSVSKYEVTQETLLPIPTAPAGEKESLKHDYIFEPNQVDILNRLLPKYLEVRILKALLESEASEHAARMTAMDTASNNCRELINVLTLVYNKARQSAITKELLDIVGGAEALKK
ncbi:MAG TPA: ATP synthase F1 subunit gamma [Thermodesulfobacteriota bacterium]|nr:ATP synthase F1 subunit gamma [Deltaproteobacteria bacterium]HNR12924.1 ATP synthase F1 subunit gamma [Thermodesulfobacteriota bacterium]HNU70685.1 ATP synthase F1 subunit gamma [Thermodesulfobacteriota bacterium]HQO78617.1 ATP synthase F1 subunit gamma [Thermodesulfobacteriota bacterium]